MKNILLIMPDYYGFDEVVFNGLKIYSNHEVFYINSAKKYNYKSIFEKVLNFFAKYFLNYNIKKNKSRNLIINEIRKIKKIDLLIVNRPDEIDDSIFEIINSLNIKDKRVFYWDSFEKINQKKHFDFFDKKFSFDSHDCNKYNLIKINNFFFHKESDVKPVFDFYFLGTEDSRVHKLFELKNKIEKLNLTVGATILNLKSKNKQTNNINYINKIIKFSENYLEQCKGSVFIDLKQSNQNGLSFRPFEALGLKRKLITDNNNIKKYDFYNSNNIFIIENNNYYKIPDFLKLPYIDISDEIYNKYYIENWIKKLIN
jgi:hypothetical protein